MMAYTYYESDPRVIREAEAAVEAGFEVEFLALSRAGAPKVETLNGVLVTRLNQAKHRGSGRIKYLRAYSEFFFRCLIKAAALSMRNAYSVVHVNNMPDFLVFSALVPKLRGAKVILDIHDPMPNTFVSKFKGQDGSLPYRVLLWQERLSAAFCDQVITVHDPVKHGILEKHGLAASSIAVVANFPDENVFPVQPAPVFDGTVRLIFHGTILERSGLRTLIEGVAGARHKDKVAVRIIGEGDFSGALREMVERLELTHIVEFDNHSYPVREIPERIRDCNLGIVPLTMSSITNYALPLKLLEYISMGLPVMSIRNSAICYYLNEEDCIFFDADRPASLSAALDRVIESPEILQRQRARSLALRKRFSWTPEKAKYINLVQKLAGIQVEVPVH